MKKQFEANGIDYELSVQMGFKYHRVICAGKGHHEEELVTTGRLEETVAKMEYDARAKHKSPVDILKECGFDY